MSKNHNQQNNRAQVISLDEVLSSPVIDNTRIPHFELDPEETIEDAQEVSFDPEPEPAEPISDEPAGDFMSAKDIGETIVDFLDGLQSSGIPYLRELKVFSKKEKELLQTIDKSGNTVYSPNSAESNVLAKWKKHQKIIDKIPFTPSETKRLVNATARYAETTNMRVTPLQGLLLAYSGVITKRTAYIFSE